MVSRGFANPTPSMWVGLAGDSKAAHKGAMCLPSQTRVLQAKVECATHRALVLGPWLCRGHLLLTKWQEGPVGWPPYHGRPQRLARAQIIVKGETNRRYHQVKHVRRSHSHIQDRPAFCPVNKVCALTNSVPSQSLNPFRHKFE